jgi:hypothetical protein
MYGDSSGSTRRRHQHPLVIGSFALLFVLSGSAFAVTEAGYLATEKAEGGLIEGVVTDYRVDDSGDEPVIVADVRIDNPTKRTIDVDSVRVNMLLDGTDVTSTSRGDRVAIPPEGSRTITVRLALRSEHEDDAVEAARAGSLEPAGTIWASIGDYRFDVSVRSDEEGSA